MGQYVYTLYYVRQYFVTTLWKTSLVWTKLLHASKLYEFCVEIPDSTGGEISLSADEREPPKVEDL